MSAALADLVPVVPWVMLVSIRVGITFAALPAPLGTGAPVQVRAVLGILVAIAIALPRREAAAAIPDDPLALGAAAIGEALIGAALGLTARSVIAIAEIAGDLAANAMGLGFASSVDPSSGEQAQLPSQILSSVATLLFLAGGGHHTVLAALAASLETAPPSMILAPLPARALVQAGSELLEGGLRLASPIVATMFVIQLAVGLVARAAPRVQIFTLTFATAATLGLLALWTAAPSMLEALAMEIEALPDRLALIVHGG